MAIFGSKSEHTPDDTAGGQQPQGQSPVESSSAALVGAGAQRQDAMSRDQQSQGRDEASRPSVISEGFSFVGEIRGKGPLTVDGSTEGVIEVGSLVIGVGGRSAGQITAKSINVKGRLSGSVNCDDLVIGGRAEVDGEVTYGSLTIQRGGSVRGDLKRK